MKAPIAGGVRALLAVALGFGVVQLASSVGHTLDLRSAAPVAPVASGSARPDALTTAVDLACPGAPLTGIKGVPNTKVAARLAAAAAPDDLLTGALPSGGAAALKTQSGAATPLGTRPEVTRAAAPAAGPAFITGTGAGAPGLAGSEEFASSTKDLRGLATTSCRPAQLESWLIGGGDGTGHQERLLLANPGSNPVTGTVTVLGDDGPVGEPQTVSVPGGSSTALLVDAVAASTAHPVVHVVADGAGLVATLAETWLSGTDARGADLIGPSAPPATSVVIPVVGQGDAASLRIASTGDAEAVARIDVLGRKGLVPDAGADVTRVRAGSTAQVELKGVAKDAVAIVVTADVPIVAAALTDTGTDVGWSATATGIASLAGLPLADTKGVKRTLNLVAPGSPAAADVVLVTGAKATTVSTKVGADSVAQVDLGDADAVWVRPSSGTGLRAAVVSTSDGGGVSVVPLGESATSSSLARVVPLP